MTTDAGTASRVPSLPAEADGLPAWVYLSALVVIVFASRLPQLLSPNLLLDGDECVVGLMAKHLAEGREFPIFFWGQNYGLSTVEAAAGALAFLVFHTGAVPLKAAMLALWTVGIVFLFLAFSRPFGRTRSFWLVLALVLNPVWAVWSMKARGGYITAFAGSAALLYLLMASRDRQTSTRWMAAGLLSYIIYLAQPLWLPGLLVIVVYFLLSSRRASFVFDYLLGAAAPICLVEILSETAFSSAWGEPDIGNQNLLGSLPRIARQIHVNLTGSYYLGGTLDPPGPFTSIAAAVWAGVLVAVVLLQVHRLVTRRFSLWSHLPCLAIVATLLLEWVLLDTRDARYLLPIGAYLVVAAGVEWMDLVDRKLLPRPAAAAAAAVVILLGSVSMVEFRAFSFMWKNPGNALSEARRLERVVDYLKSKGVTHAFATHGFLQWYLTFYSDEQIVARWTPAIDRYPAYIREMDKALADGAPLAVVGYTSRTFGIERMVDPDAIFTVDDRYFVFVGADRALLRKLRFDLPY